MQLREPSEEDLGLANVILPNGRLLRRPRAPGVLDARVRDAARARAPRQGGRARPRALAPRGRGTLPARPARRLQEQQRRQGELVRHPRELPRRPRGAVREPGGRAHAVLRDPQVFCGAGKLGGEASWDDRSAAAVPAQQRADFFEAEVGLGDHAEAPDHQHARRAARRSREVPPAARDRRRRQPVRGRDAPEGRDDGARPQDDRGRRRPRARARRAGAARSTRSRATSPAARGAAIRRPQLTPVQIQWEYLAGAKKYVEQEDTTADNLEVLERWESSLRASRTTRCSSRASSTGWPSTGCSRATASDTASTGPDPKLRLIDLQYHDVDRDKGCTTASPRPGRSSAWSPRTRWSAPSWSRRGHAGLLPRPMHRRTPTRSPPRRGTRSSSTSARMLQRVPMREPLKGTRFMDDLLGARSRRPGRLLASPHPPSRMGRTRTVGGTAATGESPCPQEQEQKKTQKRSGGEGGDDAGQVETASKGEKLKEMDDILDEIDSSWRRTPRNS